MSVHGEFERYFDAVLTELEHRPGVAEPALLAALRQTRREASADLSGSAEGLLAAWPALEARLREAAAAASVDQAAANPADTLEQTCEKLVAIARIVVGA